MNRLSAEKSPYLLQHKDNPVDWHTWGREAFDKAKRQDKPIFLSIGYSTCYWCHVMEKDSFEHQDVAEVLNREFISVKVDREERPDVDQIYMDALVGLSGHGGWPMSVFLTPELKPFWAGTFFYRSQFMQLLDQISRAWREQREQVINSSEKITAYFNQEEKSAGAIREEIFSEAIERYRETADPENGGFGTAPKFPPAMQLSFLLNECRLNPDSRLEKIVFHTLDCMAKGGIYDQLDGGFHRYATDHAWLIPHFEKMLYDNAQLARLYLEAYEYSNKPEYLAIAEESLGYLMRRMTDPGGGIYCAEDAGAVGKEGEFYLWQYDELKKNLSEEELSFAREYLGISAGGNFEGQNILNIPFNRKLSLKDSPLFQSIRRKLLEARDKRPRPHLDNKIVTSWSSLAISAYCKAYELSDNRRYLEAGEKAAQFILKELFTDDILYRHFCGGGRSNIPGVLEDYAFFTEALLNLYYASLDPVWYSRALMVQTLQDKYLWDEKGGGYYQSAAPELVIKKKEYSDHVTPSGNSAAFKNLTSFYQLGYSPEIKEKIERLLGNFSELVNRHPAAAPWFLNAWRAYLRAPAQLVVVSPDASAAKTEAKQLKHRLGSDLAVLFSSGDYAEAEPVPEILKNKPLLSGKTTYYLCQGMTCREPTNDLNKTLNLMAKEIKGRDGLNMEG